MTPVVLGALALLLAGPAPVLLARRAWPTRVPRAAIVLWQALALSAVLAALGAGLALGMDVLFRPQRGAVEIIVHSLVTALTCVVAVRLVWAWAKVAIRTRSRRRRHRALVDLLARPDRELARGDLTVPGIRILAEQTPFAYCLPGVRDSRVVVSSGALDQLDSDELAAVLTHELAHLRARHDLVLEAFIALREAFPRFVRSRTTLEQSRLLIEMLADDAARRRVGAPPVARALVTLAATSAPTGGLAAGGHGTLARVRRMAEPAGSHRLLAAATYLAAAALVVVPTVTIAIPWLNRLADLLP
ncbi:M56 family metallopeptidase [Actinopolymorpha alba]|uniref:M56 family metallopeptidase n=1 Tax=Actinopolymorpha alba TaxID=533267 RepID=UPI000363BB65|nr:M56 family metallopeptidase [Actinopolymorpha alba]